MLVAMGLGCVWESHVIVGGVGYTRQTPRVWCDGCGWFGHGMACREVRHAVGLHGGERVACLHQ